MEYQVDVEQPFDFTVFVTLLAVFGDEILTDHVPDAPSQKDGKSYVLDRDCTFLIRGEVNRKIWCVHSD